MTSLQLEEFFSPSFSIKEKNNKWKQQIITALQGIFIEIQSHTIDGKETDLIFLKKNRQKVAIFFQNEDDENISLKEIDNITCIFISLQLDIFQVINEIIKVMNMRKKSSHKSNNKHNNIIETKYSNIIDDFWTDSILLSNDDILMKRELVSYFKKWCEVKCVKIPSFALFAYMNEKISIYNNGWKGYKLNYGINENDFEYE
jgi:hypothetical protein